MTTPTSLVVIAFGDPRITSDLLESLAVHRDARLFSRIVLVDNGFPSGSDTRNLTIPDALMVPVVRVENTERSYSSGVNRGIEATDTPIVVVSNNDVLWRTEYSIEPLLAAMEATPGMAIAAPQLLFPDDRWQRSAGAFPTIASRLREMTLLDLWRNRRAASALATASAAPDPVDVDYIDGAFFAVQRRAFDEVGGFDESCPFYGEDVEFSWQAARRRYRRAVIPAARIVHLRGTTSAPKENTAYLTLMHQSKIRFVARHSGTRAARLYRHLTSLYIREIAVIATLSAWLRPTPLSRRRQLMARLAVRALRDLPADVLSPGAS